MYDWASNVFTVIGVQFGQLLLEEIALADAGFPQSCQNVVADQLELANLTFAGNLTSGCVVDGTCRG
jgi:hypothetical protein